MLTLLDGAAASAHTVASLRAACEVLRVGLGVVRSVSVSGRLGREDGMAMPVLKAAERLGTEYDYALTVRLDRGTFEVRFSRRVGEADERAEGA